MSGATGADQRFVRFIPTKRNLPALRQRDFASESERRTRGHSAVPEAELKGSARANRISETTVM